MFGAAWVSDRHLVTGSRDGAIALWDVRDGCDPPVQKKDFHSKKDMVRKFAVGGSCVCVLFLPSARH